MSSSHDPGQAVTVKPNDTVALTTQKTLPAELLIQIFSLVNDQRTLNNIVKCSREFRACGTEPFYTNVILSKTLQGDVDKSIRALDATFFKVPELAEHVQSLKLTTTDSDLAELGRRRGIGSTLRWLINHRLLRSDADDGDDWTAKAFRYAHLRSLVLSLTKLKVLDVEIQQHPPIHACFDTEFAKDGPRDEACFPALDSIFLTYHREQNSRVRIGSKWQDCIKSISLHGLELTRETLSISLTPISLNIVHLDIRKCAISFELLDRTITACKSLRTLIFVNNAVTHMSFARRVLVNGITGPIVRKLSRSQKPSLQNLWIQHTGYEVPLIPPMDELSSLKRLRVNQHTLVARIGPGKTRYFGEVQSYRDTDPMLASSLPPSLEELHLAQCSFRGGRLLDFISQCVGGKASLYILPALRLITLGISREEYDIMFYPDVTSRSEDGREMVRFVEYSKTQGVDIVLEVGGEDLDGAWCGPTVDE